MITWSDAFSAYLDKVGLNQQDAFVSLHKAGIRATQSQISYWRRGVRPREETRDQIQRWSKGKVKSDLPSGSGSLADQAKAG